MRESTFFSWLTTSTLAPGQIRECWRKEASNQVLLPCCQRQTPWSWHIDQCKGSSAAKAEDKAFQRASMLWTKRESKREKQQRKSVLTVLTELSPSCVMVLLGSLALLQRLTHGRFKSFLHSGSPNYSNCICTSLNKNATFYCSLPSPPSTSACASPPQQHASSPLWACAPGVSSSAPSAAVRSTAWPAAPAPVCSSPDGLRGNDK